MRKMMNLEEIVFHTEIRQENLRLKQRVKELEEKIQYLIPVYWLYVTN